MLRNFVVRDQFGRQVEGQTLVEYALMIVLLTVGCMVAMRALADPVTGIFGGILAALAALNDL